MTVELLDVYDADGVHLGVCSREEVHERGLWHHVFHCIVVSERDGGVAVLQRRSLTKPGFPGLLDLSATGHLSAGEAVADGVRELEEEIGVRVPFIRLRSLGVLPLVDTDPSAEGENREFVHSFVLRDDRSLADYSFDDEEVSEVVDVDLEGAIALFEGRAATVGPFSVADFVPDVDGYWSRVLRAARLALVS